MLRVVVVVLVLVFTTLFLGSYLATDDLRSCDTVPSSKGGVCAGVDAIVAISGGDTEGRTLKAVDLYQKGWSKRIIFSGAAADKSGPSNAEAMRDIAIEAGVPSGDILIDTTSNNTRENADQTMALVKMYDIDKIILTTSPYHQRRASMEFERASAGSVEVISHPSNNDRHWPIFWWITPNGWRLATGELGRIITIYLGYGS